MNQVEYILEPKPCHRCGAGPVVVEVAKMDPDMYSAHIHCTGCDYESGTSHIRSTSPDAVKAAIENWNGDDWEYPKESDLPAKVKGLVLAGVLFIVGMIVYGIAYQHGYNTGKREEQTYWTTKIVRRGYARWVIQNSEPRLEFRRVPNYFPKAVVFRDENGKEIQKKESTGNE